MSGTGRETLPKFLDWSSTLWEEQKGLGDHGEVRDRSGDP